MHAKHAGTLGSFGSAAMAAEASAIALPYSSVRMWAKERLDSTLGLAGSRSRDLRIISKSGVLSVTAQRSRVQ